MGCGTSTADVQQKEQNNTHQQQNGSPAQKYTTTNSDEPAKETNGEEHDERTAASPKKEPPHEPPAEGRGTPAGGSTPQQHGVEEHHAADMALDEDQDLGGEVLHPTKVANISYWIERCIVSTILSVSSEAEGNAKAGEGGEGGGGGGSAGGLGTKVVVSDDDSRHWTPSELSYSTPTGGPPVKRDTTGSWIPQNDLQKENIIQAAEIPGFIVGSPTAVIQPVEENSSPQQLPEERSQSPSPRSPVVLFLKDGDKSPGTHSRHHQGAGGVTFTGDTEQIAGSRSIARNVSMGPATGGSRRSSLASLHRGFSDLSGGSSISSLELSDEGGLCTILFATAVTEKIMKDKRRRWKRGGAGRGLPHGALSTDNLVSEDSLAETPRKQMVTNAALNRIRDQEIEAEAGTSVGDTSLSINTPGSMALSARWGMSFPGGSPMLSPSEPRSPALGRETTSCKPTFATMRYWQNSCKDHEALSDFMIGYELGCLVTRGVASPASVVRVQRRKDDPIYFATLYDKILSHITVPETSASTSNGNSNNNSNNERQDGERKGSDVEGEQRVEGADGDGEKGKHNDDEDSPIDVELSLEQLELLLHELQGVPDTPPPLPPGMPMSFLPESPSASLASSSQPSITTPVLKTSILQ